MRPIEGKFADRSIRTEGYEVFVARRRVDVLDSALVWDNKEINVIDIADAGKSRCRAAAGAHRCRRMKIGRLRPLKLPAGREGERVRVRRVT